MFAPADYTPVTLRRGFTLVEMLVVMAIIAVLASISVYAFQPFQSKSAVNNGGVLLQSWFTAAKQRALRDQQPRGIRLLIGDEVFDDTGTAIPWLVTKCIFIEQQDDITGTIASGANNQLTTTAAMPANIDRSDYAYVEINGGLLHQIDTAPIGGNKINLLKPIPYTIPQNTGASFRIFRSPRAVTNTKDTSGSATEDILRLPQGAAIHLKANADYAAAFGYGLTPSTPPGTPPIDIMFSPNGSVVFPSPHYDKIILWVTGTQRSAAGVISPFQGQPNFVVINSRTGFIAGYTVPVGEIVAGKSPYSTIP